ncbi:MAG: hypothetical protein A2151_04205 [Candidatus Muproteobacteria bacterium RBG_16_65_34]|uniref:Glutathione S-transferase n=1 Tax=Candidatus Muproteobacteria bacterium RBG_16_65_34 TaxID=1817760 RepID=A0A1F6TTH3_9PROT|nr:MAG: hypothetical protein A2151_04205 [Candidatus Muproteobacteria bacterium RBG_16_65_34]
MKLYGSLTSPYVRKVRVLIREKNLPVEFVVAGPGDPGSPVPALNPLGKVPVLALDGETADAPHQMTGRTSEARRASVSARGPLLDPIGDTLFDSPVIVEYLDTLASPPLLAASGAARWEMLRWEALADGILDATVARVMETRRPAAQQSAPEIARQEEKIARALDYAERRLKDGPWLVPERLSVADLALGVALEYIDFRYPHDWRARHPRLARWLAGISARPSLIETRPPQK